MHMKLTVRTLVFSILLMKPLLSAEEVKLTLPAVPAYALKNNPDLAAARLRIAEAEGRLAQAGRLSNPETEFEYGKNPRSFERNIGVSFTQKFPITHRLQHEKALSRHLLAQAAAEIRNEERKLVAEASAAAVKLLTVDQKRQLLEEQARSSASLTTAVEKRTQAGEISPTDAAQLAIDGQHGLLELQQLRGERAALAGELKPLLGIRAEAMLTLTGSLPPIAALPGSSAGNNRPDLEASRIAEQAAGSEVALARSSRWEDIGVGLTYEHAQLDDDPVGREKENTLGFRISLPLPLWNRQKGLIAEKEAAAQRAALETKALEARIKGEAAAAHAEMAANAKLHADTLANLLPTIARHAETIEKAYNKGEADLMSLLRSREQKLHAQTAALEALRDYHLAKARFEAATGTQPALRHR